jgi:hypothetical protein
MDDHRTFLGVCRAPFRAPSEGSRAGILQAILEKDMVETYTGHGIQFSYPPDWPLTEQTEEGHVTITVNTPETAFWSVVLFPDRPDPDEVVAAVVAAFREEYAEMDDYPLKARLVKKAAVAREIDFFCHELPGTARLHAVRTLACTILVLFQGADREMSDAGPVFERITRSLALTDSDP